MRPWEVLREGQSGASARTAEERVDPSVGVTEAAVGSRGEFILVHQHPETDVLMRLGSRDLPWRGRS